MDISRFFIFKRGWELTNPKTMLYLASVGFALSILYKAFFSYGIIQIYIQHLFDSYSHIR